MILYTICFLKQKDRFLLLNRSHPPVMGLWNGVGGKLEQGESPLAGVLREVREETGIHLDTAVYKGIISWNVDGVHTGGMHAFVAELPEDLEYTTPLLTDEGILAWKELSWLLHKDNAGVPENLPLFLPTMLTDPQCYWHQFHYQNNRVISYQKSALSEVTVDV